MAEIDDYELYFPVRSVTQNDTGIQLSSGYRNWAIPNSIAELKKFQGIPFVAQEIDGKDIFANG